MKEYSSPKQISSLHLTKLSNILHDNLSLQIKHAILQIELYDEQIAEIEVLYKSILDAMDSPILTIPGMSYNQAAVIVGCIGNINRFEHSCQLLAYSAHNVVLNNKTFKESYELKRSH